MYQVPVAYLLLELVTAGLLAPFPSKVLVWVMTIGCAHLSYRLIESRALALKARFPYRP
jgi:peptidoglycan/LPS O-acetylase OafA/YrhL